MQDSGAITGTDSGALKSIIRGRDDVRSGVLQGEISSGGISLTVVLGVSHGCGVVAMVESTALVSGVTDSELLLLLKSIA